MSRPETINDLPAEKTTAPAVTIHNVSVPVLTADDLRSLAGLVEGLGDSSLECRVQDDGSVVYMRHLTVSELKRVLLREQDTWDWLSGLYSRARGGEVLDSWRQGLVDKYARAEGLDPIDWDALDEAEAEEGGETA